MVRRVSPKKQARPRPRSETADQALRRHLAEQWAVVARSEQKARAGSVQALHDIRVALRRMRSLAKTFVELDANFLGALDQQIENVCDRMGAARDVDVWIALFSDVVPVGGTKGVPARERRRILAELRQRRTRLTTEALDCAMFRRMKKKIRDRLRKRRAPRRKPLPPPEAFAARRMRTIRRLIEARHGKVGNFSKKPAHDLRRAGRRLRYLAEFFAEDLGRESVRAGHWITKAQAALGKMHDCDSALDLSRDLPSGAARAEMRKALRKRRASQLRKFKTAWRRYADRRLQKAWLARLETWAAGS